MVRQHGGPGFIHNGLVAVDVVMVLVRVENLGDFPARLLGRVQTFLAVERINRQGLAGFGACHQVVEIAVVVTGPDLFYKHALSPRS